MRTLLPCAVGAAVVAVVWAWWSNSGLAVVPDALEAAAMLLMGPPAGSEGGGLDAWVEELVATPPAEWEDLFLQLPATVKQTPLVVLLAFCAVLVAISFTGRAVLDCLCWHCSLWRYAYDLDAVVTAC